MTDSTDFWTRADALLDERRDPFADEEICARVVEHPEWADELIGVIERVRALRSAAELALHRRALEHSGTSLSRTSYAALAAALLLVFFALRGRETVADTSIAEPRSTSVASTSGCRVLAFRAEVQTHGFGERRTRTLELVDGLIVSRASSTLAPIIRTGSTAYLDANVPPDVDGMPDRLIASLTVETARH